MKTTSRSNDPRAAFNRDAQALRTKAESAGMRITAQWETDGYQCFHAHSNGNKNAVFAECGACVNIAGRVWYTLSGGGILVETCYIQRKT